MNDQPLKIELSDVAQSYSGKAGCMCGCLGNYRVASKHRELCAKNRGYDYEENEVSDRSVKITVNKMNKIIASGNYEKLDVDEQGQYVALTLNSNRIYVVYLVDYMKESVARAEVRKAEAEADAHKVEADLELMAWIS